MGRFLFGLAGAASALLIAAEAGASTCVTTIMIPSVGTTSFAALSQPGVCVQDQNETFSNFNLRDLPAGGTVSFNFASNGSEDDYDITFSDTFAAGTTYQVFGYTVTSTGADITRVSDHPGPAGAAMVAITPVPIDLPQNRQFTPLAPTAQIDYTPAVMGLIVTETVMVGNTGHLGFVQNTILRRKKVPEPAPLTILVGALAGLGLARRRRKAG